MVSPEEILAAPGDATTSLADRIARADARDAARAKLEADEKLDARLTRSEIAERFEKELSGREGREFAIVDVTEYGEGFVVVKLGSSAYFKAYMASNKSEMDADVFMSPCVVHPAIDRVRAMVSKRLWIGTRITNALVVLNGIENEAQKGK